MTRPGLNQRAGRSPPVATLISMAAVGFAVLLPALPAVAVAGEITTPVARVAIYPGDTITSAMIEERRIPAAPEPREPLYASRDALIGKVARRTLLPGQSIPRHAVREPDLVRAGRPVTLQFQAGGLLISGRGTALQAGVAGDVISAQNQDSGAIVRGTVQADGTLRLGD